jgi:hypothetical protein
MIGKIKEKKIYETQNINRSTQKPPPWGRLEGA